MRHGAITGVNGCNADTVHRGTDGVSIEVDTGTGASPAASYKWAQRMAQVPSIGAGRAGTWCPAQQDAAAGIGHAVGATFTNGSAHPSRARMMTETVNGCLM